MPLFTGSRGATFAYEMDCVGDVTINSAEGEVVTVRFEDLLEFHARRLKEMMDQNLPTGVVLKEEVHAGAFLKIVDVLEREGEWNSDAVDAIEQIVAAARGDDHAKR